MHHTGHLRTFLNTQYIQRFFQRSFSSATPSHAINKPRPVFDRKSKQIQKCHAAMSPNVSLYEYLKEEVAFRLSDRVADIKRSFPLVLDVGCSRGFVSKCLSEEVPDAFNAILQGDMSEKALKNSFSINHPKSSIVFDEEKLPFRSDSFDIALSNLSFHWINDVPGCFSEIRRVLKPDGCFIGVMFGGDTLFELRCSMQLAETEREGGIAPHVSPMMQGHHLANLLTGAGFNLVTLDFDEIVVRYPSMFELMFDLQGMAENNALFNRKMLHRDTMMAAAAVYKAMYGEKEVDSVPATFQLFFMIGWKPHQSQPKPLKRGEVPKGFQIKKDEKPG